MALRRHLLAHSKWNKNCFERGLHWQAIRVPYTIMHTGSRLPFVTIISRVAALFLVLAAPFITGCDDPASDSAASSSPTPATEANAPGVVLRAEPNPVPAGPGPGTTTISWDTGSDAAADVYVVNGDKEIIFGRGARVSQDAAWIQPGSHEFRMYSYPEHKFLAKVIVTRPQAEAQRSPTP